MPTTNPLAAPRPTTNLAPVRLGQAKGVAGIMDSIAQVEVRLWVPDLSLPPALQLREVLATLGLSLVRLDLGEGVLGALDLAGGSVILSTRLREHCSAGTFMAGLERAVTAHEVAHFRIHRAELKQRVPMTDEHEREANAYAAGFLLPRNLLANDRTLLRLQERVDRGQVVPEPFLWDCLRVVAARFGVCRSLVVNRLARLGFIERRGTGIVMGPSAQPRRSSYGGGATAETAD